MLHGTRKMKDTLAKDLDRDLETRWLLAIDKVVRERGTTVVEAIDIVKREQPELYVRFTEGRKLKAEDVEPPKPGAHVQFIDKVLKVAREKDMKFNDAYNYVKADDPELYKRANKERKEQKKAQV